MRREADIKLLDAVLAGNLTTCQEALVAGADANVIDDRYPYCSAIHYAAAKANIEIINTLVNSGGCIETINIMGDTPLYTAIYLGDYETVSCLIAHQANINIHNVAGETPLHISCYKDSYAITKLLLQKGAEVDATNIKGFTPLRDLCNYSGNPDIVRLLLVYGANPEFRDPIYRDTCAAITPLEIATKENHIELVRVIKSHRKKTKYKNFRAFSKTPLPETNLEISAFTVSPRAPTTWPFAKQIAKQHYEELQIECKDENQTATIFKKI